MIKKTNLVCILIDSVSIHKNNIKIARFTNLTSAMELIFTALCFTMEVYIFFKNILRECGNYLMKNKWISSTYYNVKNIINQLYMTHSEPINTPWLSITFVNRCIPTDDSYSNSTSTTSSNVERRYSGSHCSSNSSDYELDFTESENENPDHNPSIDIYKKYNNDVPLFASQTRSSIPTDVSGNEVTFHISSNLT